MCIVLLVTIITNASKMASNLHLLLLTPSFHHICGNYTIYTCYCHVSSLISGGANLSTKCCVISSNDSFIHKRLTTSADELSIRTLVLRCPTQVDRRITSCACGSIKTVELYRGHNQQYFNTKDECI